MPNGSSVKTTQLVATLVAADETALTLERADAKQTRITVQRSSVVSLEQSLAKSRKPRGATLGLLIGGVSGAALGYAIGDDSHGTPFCTFGGCATLRPFGPNKTEGAVILGIAFGAIGAGIGALVSPGDRWQRVPKDGFQVGVGAGGGTSLGVRWVRSF